MDLHDLGSVSSASTTHIGSSLHLRNSGRHHLDEYGRLHSPGRSRINSGKFGGWLSGPAGKNLRGGRHTPRRAWARDRHDTLDGSSADVAHLRRRRTSRLDCRVSRLGWANCPAPATVAGDLGGLTLAPGLYKSTSTLGITGALTLDGGGNANAIWIFQIASSFTTAGSSSIVLAGGAQSHNTFWQVGSSAKLGTNSTFNGSILALTDITLKTGATLNGRALARNGAVALDTNIVTVPSCP